VKKIFLCIATGFGIGYLPGAPGTYGALLAIIIYFFLPNPIIYYIMFLILAIILGILAAKVAEKYFGKKDPSQVVIDEMLGMWLALLNSSNKWFYILGAFLFFRFFDILKPFPIKKIEKIGGGLGIVLDDLMAGIYTLIILQILKNYG